MIRFIRCLLSDKLLLTNQHNFLTTGQNSKCLWDLSTHSETDNWERQYDRDRKVDGCRQAELWQGRQINRGRYRQADLWQGRQINRGIYRQAELWQGRQINRGRYSHKTSQVLTSGLLNISQKGKVSLTDGLAWITVWPATLRQKLQTKFAISPSHRILTPG